MNETATEIPISSKPEKLGFWLVALRGLIGRCPHCGHGKLFRGYLKPVEHCAVCNERFGHIRADDGPAWLTIVVVGHILAPILLIIPPNSEWSDWTIISLMSTLALILALLVLPRAKGMFIGIIWRSHSIGAEHDIIH